MNTERFQQDFLQRMEHRRGIAALFDFLPAVHLFIKDRDSRFVLVSAHNLTLLGAQREADVIGKSDRDFFLPEVAERYVQEDRQVMQTQRASANRAWMVPDASGLLQWFLCTKIPLFDRDGEVIGLAGTLQKYESAGLVLEPYQRFDRVVQHVEANYQGQVRLAELAALTGLSESQFSRRFKALFHMTPARYLAKTRIAKACVALLASDSPVTSVALDVGFCDHSYFTRRFRAHVGMTPSEYRRRFASGR